LRLLSAARVQLPLKRLVCANAGPVPGVLFAGGAAAATV